MKRFQLCLIVTLSVMLIATSSVSQQTPTPKSGGPDEPIAFIDTVTFEGATTVSNDVKAAIAGALRGETRHLDWPRRFQAKAQREFQNAGFLDAAVTTKVNSSRHPDGLEHVTMLVAVVEGPRYYIESIKWTGSTQLSPGELERLSGLHSGDPFSVTALTTAGPVVRGAFAERGFRDAYVAPSFNKSPESAKVALYMDVTAGAKDANFQPPTCNQLSAAKVRSAPFVPSTTYDPKRDGELDIARAELEAERLRKKVLVFVGGQWCAPCVALERAFTKSSRLTAILNDRFVVVHVNFGEGNTNECALRSLPNAAAYPMVYVLDAKGKLLASHNPVDWQSFEGFDSQHIEAFLRSWQ